MALRSQILDHTLPLLHTQSFTRPALVSSLRTLKPEIQDADSVIDTIFGSGSVGPVRSLVEFWEDRGRSEMEGQQQGANVTAGKVDLEQVLSKRLEWSAAVGEHLVEAYANLITPSSTPSIPLPSLPILRQLLSSIKLPPAYSPPSPLASSSTSSSSPLSEQQGRRPITSILDQLSSMTGHRIPLLSTNPIGPLTYAWRIADQALYLVEQKNKPVGQIKRGYWNEPVGPGPEWYTKRIGLAAAYLSAESRLLQPYPQRQSQIQNPHLPAALSALSSNLKTYRSTISSLENTEQNLGDVAGFIEFVGKSWQGIIRSRYF
ncbi:hypothetical protein I317_01877 [Kwoniella heveanensis CBS 569]|nr:hypothetical protein I317_01877 [Kwoniella heveanensis CBS 569]